MNIQLTRKRKHIIKHPNTLKSTFDRNKNNTTKRDRNYHTEAVLDTLYSFDKNLSSTIKNNFE